MDVRAIIKGVSVGTAAGFAVYTMSAATKHKRRSLKRNTSRAARAAGNIFDDIASLFS